MPLPNLIVIGAQKCGTTSLKRYLDLHPAISIAEVDGSSELRFFSSEEVWIRGIRWYERQFADTPVRGEGSPFYAEFPFSPFVPERMRRIIPDVRLLYLVRDPIERLVSGWHFERCHGFEHRSFEETFASLGDNVHVARSRYATQLDRYLLRFPQERILVVDQHDLRHAREETLRGVFRFLGVEAHVSNDGSLDREWNVLADARWLTPAGRRVRRLTQLTLGRKATHFVGSHVPTRLYGLERAAEERPVVSGGLRERLAEQLAPEAERLRALTGRRFSRWSL